MAKISNSASPNNQRVYLNRSGPVPSMPYSGREHSAMSSETFLPSGAHNQTDVYAVHGADPEVLAYAMAKYPGDPAR